MKPGHEWHKADGADSEGRPKALCGAVKTEVWTPHNSTMVYDEVDCSACLIVIHGSKWPRYLQGQRYVVDKVGVIWLLLPEYSNGMATTATTIGQTSVGIAVLRNERGPLYFLDLTAEIKDHFAMMYPDCETHEPVEVSGTQYNGLGIAFSTRTTVCRKCERVLEIGVR